MSLIGKTTPFITLKRQELEAQVIANTPTYQNIAFAHQATAGQTGIDLTSLNAPAGFLNPSPTALLNANVGFFQNNLTLISSVKGILIPTLSFTTAGAQRINFVGFAAEQDEIFYGAITATPRTGLNVVDARSIGVTGSLIVGATDFNVGSLFQVNYNSLQQVGQVVVFRNGLQQYRCVGNNAANEGDYTELDLGNGYGQVIRFKIATALPDSDSIMVVSNGLIAEKPDSSQLAEIERVAGQVERLIPYVAQTAGVDESDLRQFNPTNLDLKAFGDIVLGMLSLPVPIVTDWTDAGPVAISAVTTAPTKGTATITQDHLWWRRVGTNMEVRIEYRQTAAGTATAGTGDYLFPIGGGFLIDTTKLSAFGGATVGSNVFQTTNNIVGSSQMSGNAAGVDVQGNVYVYDANFVRLGGILTQVAGNNSSMNMAGSTGTPLTLANQAFFAHFSVPIQGWAATQTLRAYLQSLGISV